MQIQALRQANELRNQYRQQYADQLSTVVKDAYSALDEGLKPEKLPSEDDFIRAKWSAHWRYEVEGYAGADTIWRCHWCR